MKLLDSSDIIPPRDVLYDYTITLPSVVKWCLIEHSGCLQTSIGKVYCKTHPNHIYTLAQYPVYFKLLTRDIVSYALDKVANKRLVVMKNMLEARYTK